MANNPKALFHRVLPTAHRLLLERIIAQELPKLTGDVLVLGAGHDPHRSYLTSAKSVCNTDVEMYPTIDQIADAESLPFPDNTYDAVVAIEVFEHVRSPWKATSEMLRVLKPGGIGIVSMPFLFRIHGDPNDFTRLTAEGLRALFGDFSQAKIQGFGGRIHVISDLITTSTKAMVAFRIFNHLLTCWILGNGAPDSPTGYWARVVK